MSDPVCISLDQATESMGWSVAALSGRILDAGVQQFRGKRAADRIPLAVTFAVELFESYRERGGWVSLEKTWSGRNPATVDVLAVLRGRLWQAAADRGFDVRELAPSAWRTSVGVDHGGWGPQRKGADMKAQAVRLASVHVPIIAGRGSEDMAEAVLMSIHLAGVARVEMAARRSACSA